MFPCNDVYQKRSITKRWHCMMVRFIILLTYSLMGQIFKAYTHTVQFIHRFSQPLRKVVYLCVSEHSNMEQNLISRYFWANIFYDYATHFLGFTMVLNILIIIHLEHDYKIVFIIVQLNIGGCITESKIVSKRWYLTSLFNI